MHWQLTRVPSAIDVSGEYNWHTDANVATAGYFEDLASHCLDLFIYFFGDIKDAAGVSLNQQGLYSANDAVAASWLHESGVTGTGSWNFGAYKQLDAVQYTEVRVLLHLRFLMMCQ